MVKKKVLKSNVLGMGDSCLKWLNRILAERSPRIYVSRLEADAFDKISKVINIKGQGFFFLLN